MKKIYLLALVLIGLSAKAQTFQYWYGDDTHWEYLTDGHNAYSGGNTGHFLIGTGGWTIGGDFGFKAQRTNINGLINTPGTFNNEYYFTDMYAQMPYGLVIDQLKSFEFPGGSGFGIAASYSHGNPTPNVNGLFYSHMDPIGNILSSVGYTQTFIPPADAGMHVTAVTKSLDPDKMYITGYITHAATGNERVFVLKLNEQGTIIWSGVYDLSANVNTDSDISYDIIENEVYNPNCNCNEVLVVGEHIDQTVSPARGDGFILRINSSNGTVTQPADFYGAAGSWDVFTAISHATNPDFDPAMGFVVCGYTNMVEANGNDVWFLALTNDGNIVTEHRYNYNTWGSYSTNDFVYDIIEHVDMYNNYYYYMSGYTNDGNKGANDAIIIMPTFNGTTLTSGQFTYGTVDHERGFKIDKLTGYGADDGLTLFGHGINARNILSGNYDHYLVKAGFNGFSKCKDEVIAPFRYIGGSTKTTSPSSSQMLSIFNSYPVWSDIIGHPRIYSACYNPGDPDEDDGDNSRIAPTEPKGDKEAVVSPNPMAQGSPVAMVEIEAETNANVQVAIYDMLGKQYYNGQFTLVKGKNQLPVDVSNANMAAGMYTIKVSGTNINKNILLMVK